jgi:HSP20 family molecular chaperone IbpA
MRRQMSCGTLFTQTTKNGVREVRMPKTEEDKNKTITVKID